MLDFYTFFCEHKGNILISGYKDDVKYNIKKKLTPYFFVDDPKGDYKTIKGTFASKVNFCNTHEARSFFNEYENVDNFNVYGSKYFDYVFINDHIKDIRSDNALLRYGNYDIETDSDGGFANLEEADKEIISIALGVMQDSEIYVLGIKEYNPDNQTIKHHCPNKKVIYIQCENEKSLLIKFISLWQRLHMDIITGWNIEGYDNPYICRRINRVLGGEYTKKLSPFGIIKTSKFINNFGKEQEKFEIVGIPTIDYMDAYKKFSFKNSESFSLDFICSDVLGKNKLDYAEYKTLNNLYKQNHQKFYDYNTIDVYRVEELENKLKFIDLIFTLAHFTKTNLVDQFSTIKSFDVFIHNKLLSSNIVIPNKKKREIAHRKIAGGYVKPPKIGLHKAVMSFDFTSLYPSIIRTMNISPETYVGKNHHYDNTLTPDKIVNGEYQKFNKVLKKKHICMTGKGTYFTTKKQGFIPNIMEEGFALRSQYKKEMLKYKKLNESDPQTKYQNLVIEFENKQMAVKILLNSLYGSIANQYSRWFDYDIAESITLSGQMINKAVEKSINEYFTKKLNKQKDFILYMDTDSVYIDISDFVDDRTSHADYEKLSNEIKEKAINPACEFIYNQCNVFSKNLDMKIECIGSGLWRSAKNYIMSIWYNEGVIFSEPQIKMQGIEAVKSSTPGICRKAIKDVIKLILTSHQDDVCVYINDFKNNFFKQPFHVIASPRGVSNIDKWGSGDIKGTPFHVKASLLYNKIIKDKRLDDQYPLIKNGDKIKLCYIKTPNPYNASVIACPDELPVEFSLNHILDYKKQYEKTFLNPLTSISDIAMIDLDNKIDIGVFYE